MPSEILNLELEPKQTKSTKSQSKTTKKSEPSLFDTMLSKNKSKLDTSEIKEKTTKTTNDSKNSLFDRIKTKTQESKETTKTTSKVKSSLFDKLKDTSTKEIKKSEDVKESKETTKTTSKVKSSVFDELKDTTKTDIENTNKITKNSKNKELESIIKKEDEVKIISDNIKENNNVNLQKNDIDVIKKDTVVKNKKPSLLDSLVKDIKENTKVIKQDDIKITDRNSDNIKEKLNAKTFLSNQKTKATIVSKYHLEESKKILVDDNKKGVKSKIINSAKVLELNPSDLVLKEKEESKSLKQLKIETKINEKLIEQTTFLNKVLFKQALNINNEQRVQEIKTVQIIDDSKSSTKEIKAKDIEINETSNQTAIQHITNKIISARQNMKSFMSDMARKMYENYKPPVTAFKINLNPAHLGSISIVMKSNKAENSISISLNTSSSSTLEVLEGSKGLLQNSLLKTFSNENNFSLDFSQNNNNESNSNEQNNHKSNKQNNINEEEQDELIENDISINDDYM